MATETPAPETLASKKKSKTALLVVVILVVEAVAIIGAMMFLGGGPSTVSAVELDHGQSASEDDKLVEVRVLEAKMPNNKSGVTYIFATEIFVQVRKAHQERVQKEIEQFQNEIKADITAIWRTAEPQHFQEPKLENLTRKVYALLNERFGVDKQRNEPIISKVVIVMSTGFRVDT